MPQDYFHGSRTIELEGWSQYIRTVNAGVIGMVCTSNDADATVFPENQPVLLTGYNPQVVGKAGNTGTLAHALDAIYDQGFAPPVCVVRVPTATDEAQQRALVMGEATTTGHLTGLKALRLCQNQFGITPRILGAPALDKHVDVANDLLSMADQLRGFAYLGVPADNAAQAIQYREHFGQKRGMLIWPDFVDAKGTLLATARALGLRAKIDEEVGWHRVISNYTVNGVSGISHAVDWNLQTSDTTAHYLNSHEVTTLINREGYRFWGSRTLSTKTTEAFESYVRTGDILAFTMADAMFREIDGPVTAGLVCHLVRMVNDKFKQYMLDGYILGGECWIDSDDNMASAVMSGKLVMRRKFTPVPPLEDLMQKQVITDEFVVNLFG